MFEYSAYSEEGFALLGTQYDRQLIVPLKDRQLDDAIFEVVHTKKESQPIDRVLEIGTGRLLSDEQMLQNELKSATKQGILLRTSTLPRIKLKIRSIFA